MIQIILAVKRTVILKEILIQKGDDTNPLLREKALGVFYIFLNMIEGILEEGIKNGELKADIDTKAVTSFIVATLEGSIMASKLERDNKHVTYSQQQLLRYLSMLQI